MNLTMSPTPARTKALSLQRLVSVGSIVILHIGLLFALQQGTLSHLKPFTASEVILMLNVVAPSRPEPPADKFSKTLPAPASLIPSPPVIPLPEIAAPAISSPISFSTQNIAETPPSPQQTVTAGSMLANETASVTPRVVDAVEYLRPPNARYPHHSRRMGEQGRVILHVLVNAAGHPEKVDIHKSSGFPRLDDAARLAMMQAIFRPYMENGKALPVIATASINFTLDA